VLLRLHTGKWGLRDYGTARWEGGDAECDHRVYLGGNGAASSKQTSSAGTQVYQAKNQCPKCGATRTDSQLGLEKTPEEYVANMVSVFREVRRVLRKDGTLWLNLADSYAGGGRGFGYGGKQDTNKGCEDMPRSVIPTGLKAKDLCGIPWRVAFALQADGWYLRQDIIWAKPNPMPESVKDRCTKSHEYIFLLTKSARYYYDADAISVESSESYKNDSRWVTGKTDVNYKEGYEAAHAQNPKTPHKVFDKKTAPQKVNRRSVWTITTKPFKEAHFATFPEEIPRTCILAGSKKGDTILDPFSGAGTTGVVAEKLGRKYIGIELNPEYVKMSDDRIWNVQPLFAGLEL